MAKLTETLFAAIDTETTGADPETAEIIEIAIRLFSINSNPSSEKAWSTLIKPNNKIPPSSSAVHHITDDDVKDSPDIFTGLNITASQVIDLPLIAHNAEYDQTVMEKAGFSTHHEWIDTYRLAMRIWAIGDKNSDGFELTSFSQQELRYWLKLPKTSGDAHRAAADIEVTAHLFRHAVKKYLDSGLPDDYQKFILWLNEPIIHRAIPFGWGLAGKQPDDLEDWQLKNAFKLDNNKRQAYIKFNVLDFLLPAYQRRFGKNPDELVENGRSLYNNEQEKQKNNIPVFEISEKQITTNKKSFKPKGRIIS